MGKPSPGWCVEWSVRDAIRNPLVASYPEPYRFNNRKTLMTSPKRLLILSLAMAATGAAFAEDVGRVLSAQPIIQQVAVPRKVCSNQLVEVQQQKSGAGAAMGVTCDAV